MAEEQLVLAYYDGTIFSFERAQSHSPSVFGGPMMTKVSGIEHGPKPLHMIARLAGAHFGLPSKSNLFDVPLIYGMCYDGCGVEYRVDSVGNIELLRLSPTQSSDDWPYLHYPPLLPYVPLQIGATRRCSYTEFAEPFPNMPDQQQSELVVVVPPPATLGVSLWGAGDVDDVVILFECYLEDSVVYVSNLID
jgi:hypothetical protein